MKRIYLLFELLYPLLSAYPQEIIFRGFFFHRYKTLFPQKFTMIIASSLVFGFAHLLYGNWVAPVFSVAGGVLFAYRYLKSGSILRASEKKFYPKRRPDLHQIWTI